MQAAFFCRIPFLIALMCAPLVALSQSRPPSGNLETAVQLVIDGKQAEAESLLRSLSATGDRKATTLLGAMLGKVGRTRESVEILEPLAQAGDPEAQWFLFLTYANSTPPNNRLAERWLTQSAAGGNAKAIAVLKQSGDLRPDSEGKVLTQELVNFVRTMITDKIATFSDKTVACYKASRSELISIFNQSLDACASSLPSWQQERVVPTSELNQGLASCANAKVFERTKSPPSELLACFNQK